MPISQPRPVHGSHPGLVSVDGRQYPLTSVGLEARAEGGVALTTLTQSYLNPYDEPLEVLYTLPLPADAAVIGYTVRFGERVIRGEVERREDAARKYQDALLEGRTAALLEQERDDTFFQRLGSLPPRQSAEIDIVVLQPLAFVAAAEGRAPRWEYRFPTVVGVRYQGEPGRVPDREHLDPDRVLPGAIPTRMTLQLDIADRGAGGLAVESPSHSIVCERHDGRDRVRLAGDERLDRDLLIQWNACSPEVGVQVVEGPGLPGDDGRYALITLTPPALPGRALARDLTILLDTSGSMSGPPLGWAKEVAAELLRSLEPGDRFELMEFGSAPRSLTGGMVVAQPERVQRALHGLRSLEAGGGTEMTHAIFEALKSMREDSQRQVVLISDGQIGFESEVVGQIVRRLPASARVHAVGVGAAANRSLTRGVARAGRGIEIVVASDEAAREAGRRIRQATVRPTLTEIEVGGTAVVAVAPSRPMDVFAGQPVLLAVELAPGGGKLHASGRLAGSNERWIWQLEIAAAGDHRTSIPLGALHGREAIADVELALTAAPRPRWSEEGPESPIGTRWSAEELELRIERLGLRHRIASRRTSLVAVAEEPSLDPLQPRRRHHLPVELPAYTSPEGVLLLGSTVEIHRSTQRSRGLNPLEALVRGLDLFRHEAALFGRTSPAHTLPPARIVKHEGDLLVVEFTISTHGVRLPEKQVAVILPDGTASRADVVAEQSTSPGPHAIGLTVRLGLRVPGRASWPQGRVLVFWESFELPVDVPATMEPPSIP